jgi:y4mF family transcriptional regulator
MFPLGKMKTLEIGQKVRQVRRVQGLRQEDLALTAGTAVRFISDLENGKETCQVGKVLSVLEALGIKLEMNEPINVMAEQSGTSTER